MLATLPPVTADQERLLLENWTLPIAIYRKLSGHPAVRGLGQDDAHGIGLLMMVYAVRKFDASRGIPFNLYVGRYIRRAILDAAYQHLPLAVPHYARLRGYTIPNYHPADICELAASAEPDPADVEALAVQVARVMELLPVLPPKHREAVQRHYLDGETLEAIGRKMGVTREGVRVRTLAGLRRLRLEMGLFQEVG